MEVAVELECADETGVENVGCVAVGCAVAPGVVAAEGEVMNAAGLAVAVAVEQYARVGHAELQEILS